MLKLQAEFTNMLVLTEITEPPAGCYGFGSIRNAHAHLYKGCGLRLVLSVPCKLFKLEKQWNQQIYKMCK